MASPPSCRTQAPSQSSAKGTRSLSSTVKMSQDSQVEGFWGFRGVSSVVATSTLGLRLLLSLSGQDILARMHQGLRIQDLWMFRPQKSGCKKESRVQGPPKKGTSRERPLSSPHGQSWRVRRVIDPSPPRCENEGTRPIGSRGV